MAPQTPNERTAEGVRSWPCAPQAQCSGRHSQLAFASGGALHTAKEHGRSQKLCRAERLWFRALSLSHSAGISLGVGFL